MLDPEQLAEFKRNATAAKLAVKYLRSQGSLKFAHPIEMILNALPALLAMAEEAAAIKSFIEVKCWTTQEPIHIRTDFIVSVEALAASAPDRDLDLPPIARRTVIRCSNGMTQLTSESVAEVWAKVEAARRGSLETGKLAEIVAKLPKTADNKVVSIGDAVWFPDPPFDPWYVGGVTNEGSPIAVNSFIAGNLEEGDDVSECYSTKEAAEAARRGKSEKENQS